MKLRQIVYSKTFRVPGTHTLELRPTGTKNLSSNGTRVDLDAFVVLR
ncbi:MAG: hypothetical protein M3301_00865 [Chloroflexota bacterium]|nr:hypothetical protein [Chloroflexota bacterium]